MPIKLKVKVTRENINAGRQFKSAECPIRLAIGNLLPVCFVSPLGYVSYIPNDYPECDIDTTIEIDLPQSAQDFISNFDSIGRSAVSPFEFEIEIPDSCVDAIDINAALTHNSHLQLV